MVRDARGFTLIELLLVLSILGILLGVSMANYSHARARAAETAVVAALTAINDAQHSYSQVCGNQRFAPHLTTLGKPHPGTNDPFLSPDLTRSDELVKSGYKIQMGGTEVEGADSVRTCTGDTPVTGYQVTADPATPAWTDYHFFGTNADFVIYQNNESFTGKMPEGGPPSIGQEIKGRAAQ
jgi:prepilin-type N-terminal cleavage/methylation domain-containing protein